jgi:membrane protein
MIQQRVLGKIKNNKLISSTIGWSKKIVLPGFDGLPLYDVVAFFIQGINKSSLTTRASALAFNFFLAIFPALIFLFTLIPYIPIENFQYQLLHLMEDVLPYSAFESIKQTIEDLVTRQRGGLLSFGFVNVSTFMVCMDS